MRATSSLLCRTFLPLSLLALLAVQAAVHAQDRQADPQRAIERFEQFLAKKPYHDWAFDKLVESAVAINGLGDLVANYEGLVEQSASDEAARIVLARLYAKTEQHEEALAALDAIEDKDASLYRLVGSLELRRNRTAEAIEALDRAAGLAQERELLEAIHELRGEAFLAAGERTKAHEAFHALAELEPESFPLRLEAASTLAFHGLHEEALQEFAVADMLAGEDTARRCRVLAEIGKLHEALSQGEEALVVYREAIGLMARGNWLKRDLYERVLALHTRTGLMDQLLVSAQADAEANAQDLDAREFQARVLETLGRREEARDVLVAATAEFPSDLKLSRRMIEVFTELEDPDAVIAEYQRILAEKPDELELYLELGQVFASAGRFEQAKRQWARTLEQRLTDPSLCVRLAGLYALYDQPEDAVAMYEKAIELEPGELRHFADLAGFLGSRDRKDEVPALLERATGAAAGNAGRLEELSGLWREHGDLERARVAIEAALELKTDDPHLLHRLADLLIAAGEVERATETLHLVINLARESNLRRTAVDRLLRIFYRADRADELIALEEAAIEGGSREVAPYLVLGKAWMQRREPDRAIHYLELLLEIDTESEDARISLARLHEQQGDWDVALEQYTALMEAHPQSRRKYLQAVAKIHLSRYDQDAAFACYEEILAGAPDNPAAFIEVGQAYQRLGLMDESSECLRQALRLKPEDTRTRLKLADLYRQMGEVERAEREILAAVDGQDGNLQETARKRYYELISDGGRVNEEIASLRTRIDENPYDVAAPLTLTDIYVRELEYELALDMLQKLLTYQPNEARLLSERARMLGLMDRWDEAILDYERLWKLPDADQNALALDIAGAALEQGDRERAAQVLTQVNDVEKVAGLYRRKELWDEAIETLESGLTRSPGDFRLLSSLSRLYASRGDEDGAIEVLERALELRGDSWKLIVRLGQLYHDVGRREDAIELGQQLFALIRVEEEDEDEDESEAARNSSAFRLSSARNWNRSRVSEIQSYFQGKGLLSEFSEIGCKEVLLQPTNHDLFNIVLSALQREDGKGAQALELIEAVGTATVAKHRIPTGQTERTWQRSLAQNRVNIYRRDVPFAEERATQLESGIEGGSATPESLIELARIQLYLTHKAEMLEIFEQGVELFPDSTNLLAGLAQSLVAEKRYEEALPHFERLVDMLVERGEDPQDVADEAFQREFAFKSGKQGVLQGFPIHVRRRVSDADVRRFMDLTRYRSLYLSWGPGVVQKLDGARVSYAKCLGKADRKPEASAILADLATDESNTLTDLSSIAAHYFQLDLFEEALAIYESLIERERELSADPLFGFNRSWQTRFTSGMGNLARIHEKSGDPVLAYDILRTYGDADAGELILTSHDAMGVAQANYEARVAAEEERLDSAAEGEEVDSDAWRDAYVRLAELHQMQKHWDETLVVYERIADRRPDDFAVLQTIATLHERAGRWEDAVGAHYRIIDRKRVLNRTPYRPAHPPGRVLTPKAPALPQEDNNWAWQNLQSNFRYYRGAGAGAQRFSYRENYVAILKLHMDRGEVSKAAEVMRDLARSDAQTFGWLGSSLANIMQQYRFGEAGIPILRMVYMQNPTYEHLNLQYGQALVAAKKVDEARRVLTKLSDGSSSNSYYKDQAQALLSTLDAREGIDTREGLAELRSAVEADPKSVKKRTKLARRLLSERDFEGALEHARIAEELAPHKDDVKALTSDCLQVTGREQEFEERLIESLDDIKDERLRIEAAARVANWMWARGDREAVDGVFEIATRRMSRGYPTYTSAGWYIQKGALDKAVAVMRKDLETTEKYRQTQIRQSLAAVEVALGNPMGLLDEAWEEYYLKASAQGAKSQALTQLATALRGLPGLDEIQDGLVATCLERDGMQGVLYAAAVEMAAGDLEACEKRLTEVAQPDGDTRFLYPVLVTLARARDDLPRALELLQELQGLGVASQSDNVQTTVGYLSEADALRAEIGSLHLALGDKDQALAVWEEMFDPDDDQGLKRKATLYGWHDLLDEAADMQRRYLEEVGERNEGDLDFLADLESRRGDHDAAIELWKKALILAGTQNEYQAQQYRSKLLDAYRAAGRLQDFVAELEARCEADPDDFEARKHLVRLYGEASEEERALELLNGMLERPGMADSVLPTMIQRALINGDEEQAIAWSHRLLSENMDEYQRQREAKRLGTLLLRRGQVDEGVQVILDGNLDSDGAQAHDQAAAALTAERLHEQALEHYDRAQELDPENWYRKRSVVSTLVSLGRQAEARDRVLEYLADPKGRRQSSSLLTQYGDLLDETDERERVAAALEADATDPTTRLCAARIAVLDDEPEVAIAHYEALLADDPEDGLVLQLLWAQYKKAERYSDAIAIIERLLPLVDRETGVGGLDRNYYGNSWGLRQARAELLLRGGDLAAAEAAVQDRLGRRYEQVQGYYYRYGSFQSSPPSDLITLHRNLENWERCLELYREHPQVAAPGNRRRDGSLYEVRFRAGEREQVLEDLWRTVYDPAASLFETRRYMTFYGNPQNLIRSGEPMGILVRLHRENGTMDELVQRVEAAVKRDPHLTQLVDFRRLLLAAEERWELLLPYRQEQLEKMPYDPQVQYETAQLYRRLGRDEEAIALLESARDLYRGQSFGQVVGWTYHERMNPYAQKGPVRFSFTRGSSSFSSFGSGWSSYGISTAGWGGPEDAVRRELAALYLRSGRREEALVLEQREDAGRRVQDLQGYRASDSLGSLYREFELWEDAERRALAALEKDLAKIDEPDEEKALHARESIQARAWSSLARMWSKAGDETRQHDYAERRMQLYAAALERATDGISSLLASRASFRAETLGDLDGARADLARYLEERESEEPLTNRTVAWTWYRIGEPARAREIFQASDREQRLDGRVFDASLWIGLTLCAAAAGEEISETDLRRALAGAPENDFADEARALLD